MSATATFRADQVETSFVETPQGRFAYRRFGRPGREPLVLCMRLRGTIDHWDPALLDALSSNRDVIAFDTLGTGASTGEAPTSVPQMVDAAAAFIEALGLERVDVMGWSMGGYVALGLALEHPDLVRRLIVAGSGPRGVPGQPEAPAKVWEVAPHEVNTDEDFLYLFFPETDAGREAGLRSLRRLDHRLDLPSHQPVSWETFAKQMQAVQNFAGYWDRLDELDLPVLVANGARDVMIHAYASYAMSQRLADAKVVLYSDAGHGFLFHHIEDFAREVRHFLTAPERSLT